MTGTLRLRLLGQLAVHRDGNDVPLPASRKVRAMIAYLAMNEAGASRSSLCDLLWDAPSDPRGELRWTLSKVRSVLDDSVQRVTAQKDRISLDLSGVSVDALQVDRLAEPGIDKLSVEQLRAVCDLFQGEFADGLHVDGAPQFNGWLLAQRHRYKALHLSAVERLCLLLDRGSDEHFQRLQAWLQWAPFDRRAHEAVLRALADAGRVQDAEKQLALAIRQFEAEGIEWLSLREAWRVIRAGAVNAAPRQTVVAPQVEREQSVPRRASVAVMPFIDRRSSSAAHGGVADGITEDIITRLAKLRAFFVIARGTVFALSERNIEPREAGRILNVDYVVSGVVTAREHSNTVSVEMVDIRDGRVRWAESFDYAPAAASTALADIGDRIVAAVAEELETAERNRAVLKPVDSLDAWEAYHRGLWHMYRFSGEDNDRAERHFRDAIRLDPTFARAHAGLSFAHFQNAFLLKAHEREEQANLAFASAGQSLLADDRDPAAHWAMGRALWLRGSQDDALHELRRCVELSPNFSLGHYTMGFVQSQSGDPHAAIESIERSRSLSPFDPMQFAMLAAASLAHLRLGNYDEAVSWSLKAAARPNAHKHIVAIAAHNLAVANRLDEARAFAALIRKDAPRYSTDDLLTAFHFDKDTAELLRHSGQRIGLR